MRKGGLLPGTRGNAPERVAGRVTNKFEGRTPK